MQIVKDQLNHFPESSSRRNAGLDLMRSIAILIVLFQHSLFFYPKSNTPEILATFLNLFDGVSIFFVLSGFLIGTILLRIFVEKEATFQSLLTFWKRRWLRTIPSYYFVMTLVLLFSLASNKGDSFFNHVSYYFFLQNLNFELSKFFPEAWSLSVEEWFYMLFPLILFLITPFFQKKQAVLFTILIFLVFPLLLRYYVAANSPDFEFRKLVLFRLDAIVYGVLIAYVKFSNCLFFNKMKNYLFVVGLVLLLAISIFKLQSNHLHFIEFFYSLEALSYSLFIPMLYNLRFQKQVYCKMVYFVSTRSYGLYLVNLSFLGLLIPLIVEKLPVLSLIPSIQFLLFWILNFLLAELIYRFFERPILKWRDKTIT